MLTETTVVQHLRTRGIVGAAESAQVARLAGGISAATFRITTLEGGYVVKQPLPVLAVAQSWPASQERADVEAAAIDRLQMVTPLYVPRLVDYDPDEHVLVLSAAPYGWAEWRQLLLQGHVDMTVGATLGRVLGLWHRATGSGSADLGPFQSLNGFYELRGRPYYEAAAACRPELAEPMLRCLGELVDQRSCLVHGDFSPKNVLIGPGSLWVLDFEVAHIGNPIFDLAFMLHHLVMKRVHVADAAGALLACGRAFVSAYSGAADDRIDERDLVRHVGALLLARVYGQSVTAYLTPAEAEQVSTLGIAAVHDQFRVLADFWPSTEDGADTSSGSIPED